MKRMSQKGVEGRVDCVHNSILIPDISEFNHNAQKTFVEMNCFLRLSEYNRERCIYKTFLIL